MDKQGLERLRQAMPDDRAVTWEVTVGEEDEIFADGKEVRYVTAQLADAVTPAALLNALTDNELLHGSGVYSGQGPKLKILGELSTAGLITFEDSRYVAPDPGPGVL